MTKATDLRDINVDAFSFIYMTLEGNFFAVKAIDHSMAIRHAKPMLRCYAENGLAAWANALRAERRMAECALAGISFLA